MKFKEFDNELYFLDVNKRLDNFYNTKDTNYSTSIITGITIMRTVSPNKVLYTKKENEGEYKPRKSNKNWDGKEFII